MAGGKVREFVAHAGPVNCVHVGRKSGTVFCTGGEDKKVNVWAVGQPNALIGGMIDFGPASPYPYDLRETPFFLIIAILGGVIGAAFNGLNARLCRWRRETLVLPARRRTRVLEALLIALITATVTFWLPVLFATCEPLPIHDDLSTPLARVDLSLGGTESGIMYPRHLCDEGQWNPMAQYVLRGSTVAVKGMFHDEVCTSYLLLPT